MPTFLSPMSIAPMINWSNAPFRFFMRLLAPNALVYTEMQVVDAIINRPQKCLYFHPEEKPIALQAGGINNDKLVRCAQMAEEKGFDEFNINMGCPSKKVLAGNFGACLMKTPHLVASCIEQLKKQTSIPISVKTRIGIDNYDDFEFFVSFIKILIEAGVDKLIIHARKAWLRGLNPKQNRNIPPLHYDYVYQLKKLYPTVPIIINGNIKTYSEVKEHLLFTDGVMLGRLAYQNPYLIALIHQQVFQNKLPAKMDLLSRYIGCIEQNLMDKFSLSLLLKPLFAIFHGTTLAKTWKIVLMECIKNKNLQALEQFSNKI